MSYPSHSLRAPAAVADRRASRECGGERAIHGGEPDGGDVLARELGCVGHWRLDRQVGEGRFALAYLARPANCGPSRPADYVVKLLRPHLEGDDLAVETLLREAEIGQSVSHPHLAPVLQARVASPPYFVVLPFLEGATLQAKLAQEPAMPVPVALWIARQTTEALAALHEAGWMHGDVKPANVFVSPGGHVTLFDCGLAHRIGREGNALLRPLTGTYHYIAPEMVTSTLRADGRSDIYSLGVTLFEMLTGRLPFEAATVEELIQAHLTRRPPEPRRYRPGLPPRLAKLLRRMLAKEPLRRPQSALELIRALTQLEIETFEERFAA